MRGYGDSDKPGAVEDYKMSGLVNDVKEIIEALGTLCVACVRITAETVYLLQRKPHCRVQDTAHYSVFGYLNPLVLIFMWRHTVRPFDHSSFMHSAVFDTKA
jgi:hypothetical protein